MNENDRDDGDVEYSFDKSINEELYSCVVQ